MAYTYIYVVSIIWMVWCVFDIIKFRRQWMVLTASAHDQEEYMDIVERSSQNISYFPDIYNTGGLFMRAGAGREHRRVFRRRAGRRCSWFYL